VSLTDLAAIYLVAGVACAVAVYRTSPPGTSRALSATISVLLWPLWAPIALTSRPGPASAPTSPPAAPVPRTPVAEAASRIDAALREAAAACAGTSLQELLPREAAERISAEVARAAGRHAELSALLGTEGFDLAAAEARVRALEGDSGSGSGRSEARALATARVHLENVRRIAALRDRDARALEELADLVGALRAQLALARFAGSHAEGTSGIVSEMWARVEGLGAALADDTEGGAAA
jgi:hypothetical protein